MFDIGSGELLLILIAALVFFGPRKLPQLAQSLGKGLREFKKAQREFTDHINMAVAEEDRRGSGTVSRRPTTTFIGPEKNSHSMSRANDLPVAAEISDVPDTQESHTSPVEERDPSGNIEP